MKLQKSTLVALLICISCTAFSQQPDTLIKKLDSLNRKTDSAGGKQNNNISSGAYNDVTKLTFSSYFILLGSNLKQSFTKPFHMTKKDWFTVGKFAVVAGGVALIERPLQHTALRWRNESSTLRGVSSYVTSFGGTYEVYTLATLGIYGLAFKKDKVFTTTLLATQAYATGGAVQSVLKFITGRQRPYNSDPNAVQASPHFYGPLYKGVKDANGRTLTSSFPSGHTTVAFAAATVFAKEYKNQPLIPIISYSAATLIGLSRITENKHWATDVLTGAAIGFLVGRQVSNNYHRYAKLKAPTQKKNTVTFNLQYNFGHVMPGVVYHLNK
jgi:membrane-associated phospholipid phosphatase